MSNKRPYAKKNSVVQLPLTPELVTEIERLVLDAQEVDNLLTACLLEGYEVSLSFDQERKQFVCRVRGQFADMKNAGVSFYANAQNWYTSIVVAMVKSFFGFGDKPWTSNTPDDTQKYS